MTVLWVLLLILGMIGIGVPIAFSLAAVSIIILGLNDLNLIIVIQRMYQGVQSFPLVAVPLFILAGVIMNRSGISEHLVEFARNIVGSIKGGLSAVNIVTSMFFAGMSGTSMSDTAAVGGIMIPPMVKRGFSRAYAGAVTASSSTIGIIIPPSVPMVVLAAFLGVSTGGLFAAGLLAGLLLGFGLILAAWVIAVIQDHPTEQPFSLKRLLKSGFKAAPALGMPIIILGGILGGIFTPTEASAVACVYGLLVSTFYYRRLSLYGLYSAFIEASILSGAVMLVVSTAHVLGYTFSYLSLAQQILDPIVAMDLSPILFLLVLSGILILAGTFLDGIAMMFIIVPLFFPAIEFLGIHPMHFAMVVIICWGIGQQTPPVGAALFITSVIAKENILRITMANLAFIGVMLIVLLLVILFPNVMVLWLPSVLGL